MVPKRLRRSLSRWRGTWRGAAPAIRPRPSVASPSSSSTSAAFRAPIASAGSRCAPPSGSATIRSITPERLRSWRGDPHRLGGIGRLVGGAPQDRGAAFGRDHRIDRMLEHQHAIGGGDRDRAARAALADDRGDHRHAERQALLGRAGDRLGLAALLGLDARERRPACRPGVTTGRPKRSASCISRIALR